MFTSLAVVKEDAGFEVTNKKTQKNKKLAELPNSVRAVVRV